MTEPFTVRRAYFTPPSTPLATVQQAVKDIWSAGAFMVQFTGHSSWQQWAAERLFHLDDLPALLNHRRLPIAVEMTCFTAAFHRPEPTLDEDLLLLEGRGAVAAWGATGLGVGTGHGTLSGGFHRAVFSGAASTLGEAAWSGKLSLAAAGRNLDLLDTLTLLGDPALRLAAPSILRAGPIYLPIVAGN